MKTLYLAWQDQDTRRWLPVSCLTYDGRLFRFYYTKGAEVSKNFMPFGRMTDLKAVYESEQLFPLFENRLLSPKRPEYKEFITWLDISDDLVDPFAVLALTGGIRGTDNLEVFPCPKPINGKYEVKFFNHGLRYASDEAVERVRNLATGDKLFLMHDLQNSHDFFALALRTDDPATIIGYCPRYFVNDFHHILQTCNPSDVNVTVEKVNSGAPLQFRLLCKFSAPWPNDFTACSNELYLPISQSVQNVCAL
jgi:hypothetical protein